MEIGKKMEIGKNYGDVDKSHFYYRHEKFIKQYL